MKIIRLLFLSTVLILGNFISKISFAETNLLGSEKNWRAYSTKKAKSKTCFITSEPIKTEGKFNKNNRGKPYVFVTNIKGGSTHEEDPAERFNRLRLLNSLRALFSQVADLALLSSAAE